MSVNFCLHPNCCETLDFFTNTSDKFSGNPSVTEDTTNDSEAAAIAPTASTTLTNPRNFSPQPLRRTPIALQLIPLTIFTVLLGC